MYIVLEMVHNLHAVAYPFLLVIVISILLQKMTHTKNIDLSTGITLQNSYLLILLSFNLIFIFY